MNRLITLTAATSAAVLLSSAPAATAAAHGSMQSPGSHRGSNSAGLALKASGFGTRATGGQVPAGSNQTAFTAIGCSTRVGLERENHEAEATVPSAGTASGVKTRVWTSRSGGAVHSWSRNTTAEVVLAQSGLGRLVISAVRSLSHAWHDAEGFHAATSTSIGRLKFVPPVGDPQILDLPAPGRPVVIPGLARVAVGQHKLTQGDHVGAATTSALRVFFIPSATGVTVAHTTARVLDGVVHGAFRGNSAATQVSAADGNLTSGRNPLSLMPCQGTDGKTQEKDLASLDLGGQVVASGLSSAQRAKAFPRKSVAMERGSVAGLNLGGGQLVVGAVVGQANVTRTAGGKVTSDTEGTSLGTITANGQPQTFPDTDTIEIPGVARLERNVIDRTKFGISVVALRITLLDGTGAVIDLGVAKALIR